MASKQSNLFRISGFPEDWDISQLDDYLEWITYGFTCPMATAEDGPCIIAAKDLQNNKINYETCRRTTFEDYKKKLTDKSRPKINDILLSKDGTLGRVAIVERNGDCINQSVALLRPNEHIIPLFLKYLLESPLYQKRMDMDSDGTVIKHIYITRVNLMPIAVPSKEEQQRIVNFISVIDDGLKKNEQMNKTLEAIAQALFKQWFIDFEFPDENGKPYKSSGGKMVDSELGLIPEGWKTSLLKEYVERIKGVSYRSEELQPSRTALVTLKCIARGGGFKTDGLKEYVGVYKEKQLLKENDIVVAHTDLTQKGEVLGKPAIITFVPEYERLVASLDLVIVRPIKEMNNPYLFYLLLSKQFQDHAIGYANGTTVLHLSAKAIPDFLFALPPSNLLFNFGNMLDSLLLKKRINKNESEILANLRDLLLPRLMSGKIRVPVSSESSVSA